MIKFKNVSKFFGNFIAVENLNFEIKKGEIIGFLGLNGAGKTTTMRLILGILNPSEGEVKVFGKNPVENRIEILKKVGYLPENNPLYYFMTVKEYLSFIAEAKGVKKYDSVLSQVDLSDYLGEKIDNLSRGYKQRVGLAAALISNPELLILDEPTSGLDPLEQEKIRETIKKIGKKRSVIFSTHILSEVEAVADKLIVIHEGKMVYDGKKPKGKGAVEKLFKKLVK